jgi:hypothetical protein
MPEQYVLGDNAMGPAPTTMPAVVLSNNGDLGSGQSVNPAVMPTCDSALLEDLAAHLRRELRLVGLPDTVELNSLNRAVSNDELGYIASHYNRRNNATLPGDHDVQSLQVEYSRATIRLPQGEARRRQAFSAALQAAYAKHFPSQ